MDQVQQIRALAEENPVMALLAVAALCFVIVMLAAPKISTGSSGSKGSSRGGKSSSKSPKGTVIDEQGRRRSTRNRKKRD